MKKLFEILIVVLVCFFALTACENALGKSLTGQPDKEDGGGTTKEKQSGISVTAYVEDDYTGIRDVYKTFYPKNGKLYIETPKYKNGAAPNTVYFYGWFLDSNYNMPLPDDYVYTQSVSVYGKWISVNSSLYKYSVNSGKAFITGFTDSSATVVIVPAYINSFPVIAIDSGAFKNNSVLRKVIIQEGIQSIGSSAFSGCTSLEKINIPDSVTSIGENAFQNCNNLKYNEYNNAYYLGNYNNPYMSLICAKSTDINSCTIYNFTKIISDSAFRVCHKLTSITIPDSVTRIGEGAFAYCSGLKSVYYTGDVAGWCNISFESAESNPLYYAHNLYINNSLVTDLVIPDTVKEIKSYAFSGCSELTRITIPNSVTSIGESAFSGCSGLTNISYRGITIQWQAISKGSFWKSNVPSNCEVRCTNGTINI